MKANQEIIQKLIDHMVLGKPILNKKIKPLTESTQRKYKIWLSKLDRWFDKPFEDLTQEDIDDFRAKLKNDKIRQDSGKPYSEGTKRDIEQKFLKRLLNYLGKPEIAMYSTSYSEQTEIPAIPKAEIEKIVIQSKLRDKVIFQLLFDGGFRASEFLNIKFKDVFDDQLKSNGYYKIRITKSKTKTRTIGLTMTESTEILKEWLSLNQDKVGTSQPLIDISYINFNLAIKRAGERILKKNITPHMLRHSSATYYCHHLSQYQLCKRYGWAMASDMPQRYIDREGVEEDQINGKMIEEENLNFKKELNRLKEELNNKNEETQDVETRLEEHQKTIAFLTKAIERLDKSTSR